MIGVRRMRGLISRSVARIPSRSMVASLHMHPVPSAVARRLGHRSITYFALTLLRTLTNWRCLDRQDSARARQRAQASDSRVAQGAHRALPVG
jgi:hypothetical protein